MLISNTLFNGPIVDGVRKPTLFIETLNTFIELCRENRISIVNAIALANLGAEIVNAEQEFMNAQRLLWQMHGVDKGDGSFDPPATKEAQEILDKEFGILVNMQKEIPFEPMKFDNEYDLGLTYDEASILSPLFA